MGFIYQIPDEYIDCINNSNFFLKLFYSLIDIFGVELFVGHDGIYDLCSGSEGWNIAFNNTCDELGYLNLKKYRNNLKWSQKNKFDDQIEAMLIKYYRNVI